MSLPRVAPDPVADVLQRVRLSVDLVCLSTFHAPWGVVFPDGPAHLHIVSRGTIWARPSNGSDAVRADAGDLLLFARGAGHVISDRSDGVALPLDQVSQAYDADTLSMELGGPGPACELVCCRFTFDGGMAEPLLRALPPMIHVKGGAGISGSADAALQMLLREIHRRRSGTDVVVSRLVDILFVEVLRTWALQHTRNPSWLAGVGDPRIGRVLAALHAQPARNWTAASCAEIAGLSRSGFAQRFTRVVGETPLAYLKRWRLSLAADLLVSGAPTASNVARRVGYTSDAAFNRAFKARFDVTPAAFRRRTIRPVTLAAADRVKAVGIRAWLHGPAGSADA